MGKNPFVFEDKEAERRFNFINVDKWQPLPQNLSQQNMLNQDIILSSNKGAIIAPVMWFFKGQESGAGSTDLDYFITSTKKCYNSQLMREHTCHYVNYFERFYDIDKEYFVVLANMKLLMDTNPMYAKDNFISDLRRYILSPSLLKKTNDMCRDNYMINLSYKNIANPSLQYTNDHAIIMSQMSLIMNMMIPLLTHFAYKRKIADIDGFLLEAFDEIFYVFDTDSNTAATNITGNRAVDVYSKLYETSNTNTSKNEQSNRAIWNMQDIRGKNVTSHSLSSADNIILNIMPKYVFDQNIVSLNYASINYSNNFQVVEIEFEYSFIPLSSSKRDEDSISEADRYEANNIRQNEALALQNNVNARETMNTLDILYGPFDKREIDFYSSSLNTSFTINAFQRQLIFNLFYKYFGDTQSIQPTNRIDYVKMLIIAKRILINNGMLILPYILSGKVEKLVARKSINKKDLVYIQSSPTFEEAKKKAGNNEKILKQLYSIMATIIASDFRIIDPDNPNIDGKMIETIPTIVGEEVLLYYLLV